MMIDIEGNNYKIISTAKQIWTSENLNVSHYKNGDIIPHVQNNEEWSKLTRGAWCYYDNDIEKGKIYGKLYNWYAVNDPRGLAPDGWGIPSDFDWSRFTISQGGSKLIVERLKSLTGWKDNYNGNNESGFNALPAGGRKADGEFAAINEYADFWTSSEYENKHAWHRSIRYDDKDIFRHYYNRNVGISCRCIKL